MGMISGIRVKADGGAVDLGGARISPNAGLRLAEALVRESFKAAINEEAEASAPVSAENPRATTP